MTTYNIPFRYSNSFIKSVWNYQGRRALLPLRLHFILLQGSKGNISTPFEQSYAILYIFVVLCTCVKNV